MGYRALLGSHHEVINTSRSTFHLVGHAARAVGVVGLKGVNQATSHVVYFDVDFARELLEVELHLSVVGIGRYGKGP